MTLREKWEDLVTLLLVHAPKTANALRPPVDPQLIHRTLASLGVGDVEDLREFFALHNGEDQSSLDAPGQVLPESPLFSIQQVAEERTMLVGVWDRLRAAEPDAYQDAADGNAGGRTGYFHRSYIPLGGSDGNYIFMDTRPGKYSGCVRLFNRDDLDEDGAKWQSLEEFFLDVTKSVSGNRTFDGWLPSFVNGALFWRPVDTPSPTLKSSSAPRRLHVPYADPSSNVQVTAQIANVERNTIAQSVLEQAKADHPGHEVAGGLPSTNHVPRVPGYAVECLVRVDGKPVPYIAIVTESDDYLMCVRVPENGLRLVYKPR